jgi:hypothetical protein
MDQLVVVLFPVVLFEAVLGVVVVRKNNDFVLGLRMVVFDAKCELWKKMMGFWWKYKNVLWFELGNL